MESNYDASNMSSVFLSVTFRLVTADNAGTYLCSASSLNKLHLLTKSEFSATVSVKPLMSLNVFDLTTAVAQLAKTVGNLEITLKSELYRRHSLERQVNNLTQTLADIDKGTSILASPDTGRTIFQPLHENNMTTNSSDFELDCDGNSTEASDDRLSQLERRVTAMDTQLSGLQQQQDQISQLHNDTVGLCADLEQTCVAIADARAKFQPTASPEPTTTPIVRRVTTEKFPLLHQLGLRDLPDFPVTVTGHSNLSALHLPTFATNVIFHLSACVYMDNNYSEAEKVSLEALKVSQSASASSSHYKLGLCLGYRDPSTLSDDNLHHGGTSASDYRCVCRQDAILLQDRSNSQSDLTVSLSWFGGAKNSLHLCALSTWPNDVTRKHAHLGPTCSGVTVSYLI